MTFTTMKTFPLLLTTLVLSTYYPIHAKDAVGMVLPFKEVVVSASTENTVKQVAVELGDPIKKGDLLAKLDSRIHELQVKRFERVLVLSESAYKSSSLLVKDNIISREEALKAEVERDLAQSQLDVAKVELDQQQVLSPLDGVVVEVLKEEGETVKKSEEMFVVINIDQVFLQLYLPADQAYSLQKGQELDVRFPVMPDNPTFPGTVYFIDSRIDATSGLLRTRILLKNPGHKIRAGMRGHVTLPGKG